MLGYLYIDESFDTIFNMGYRGIQRPPPPWPKGLKRDPGSNPEFNIVVYIEESFDTIFNIGYWGGGNRPWTRGLIHLC